MAKTLTETPNPKLPALVEMIGKTNTPAYENAREEFDVLEHDVMIDALDKRPKKKVKQTVYGADGNPLLSKDGKPQTTIKYIEVVRTALPLQQLIVNRRVSFMNVGKTQLEANPQNDNEKRLYGMIQKSREDNKVSFIEKEIARRMLSELEVAKLYYTTEAEEGYWGELAPGKKFRYRIQILSPEKGDQLLPVFDSNGKMIYFGRVYQTRRPFEDLMASDSLALAEDMNDTRFDIYSDKFIYKFRKARTGEQSLSTPDNNGWILDGSPKLHSYGKVPVIYYRKDAPPWAPVQHVISRIETLLSNFGDSIDYNASPIVAMYGKLGTKFMEKGEQGRALQITGDNGKVEYVTWDQATEAVQLELDTLVNFVFTCTQTPQMSMEDLKGLGAASGVAYDRIFMDAHLAAQDEIDGDYGQGTQRSINLEKAICASIDTTLSTAAKSLSITFDIPIFRINDDSETINMLGTAHEKGMLSQKTMVEYSPLTKNSEEELKQIEEERRMKQEPVQSKANKRETII